MILLKLNSKVSITVVLLLFFACTPVYAQLEVGIGLRADRHEFNRFKLPNDVIVAAFDYDGLFPGSISGKGNGLLGSLLNYFRDNPKLSVFINYHINTKKRFSYSISTSYSTKYQSIYVGQVDTIFGYSPKLAFIRSNMLQVFGNIVFGKSLTGFKLFVGLGPTFYFNGKPFRANFTSRFDLDLEEPYYQVQKIHRNISLNYSVRVLYKITKGLGISVVGSGNITPINKPFIISGNEYKTNALWVNLGLLISYEFSLLNNKE